MKKIVSLVLAMSMVLSMFVSAFAATTSTFDDVKDTKYAGAVDALVELNVIDGLPDGTYGPEKEVTRAQLAKMLVICLGLGDTVESLEGRTVFTDVADSHWASGYINAAVQSKVIAGYPDGTFKPEKNVTYAEAVTMVIRALGYGNVVEAEGTWPTAYMLKAVELELLDNMDSPKAGDAASRGNTAILLWNMLRTAMWKIGSENETNGMTSTTGAIMLNVKFPDYLYVEDVYLTDVEVDDSDVRATVGYEYYNAKEELVTEDEATAYLNDVDLSRLITGMKLSALVKDYKDAEDATFLTMTPAYSFVEGVVTDVTSTRIEIDEVEYRLDGADELFAENDYVVAEVDGKKITTYNGVAVIKELPKVATEVEKIKTMESKIDEDALVIIDGEWSSRDDIEIGDMYTEMSDFGTYYMVARERGEGAFESYTYENDGDEYVYVEIDGEKYRAFESILKIYEGEDNDEAVDPDKLTEKAKDNKYLDQDVEVVFNYLGQIVKICFGEVSELEAQGNFYAVTSDGTWYTSSSKGKQYHIVLVGADGEEETYDITTSSVASAVAEDSVYEAGEPVFVWARFNDDDQVKELEVLASGESYGDYTVEAFTAEIDDDNYLNNTEESKVSASTVVFTVTPVEDDEKAVIGFEVEITQGPASLDGVPEGLVAFETEGTTKRAKFVFVAEEAKSQDLNFGLVEKVTQSRGDVFATISGTEYEVELEPSTDVTLTYTDIRDYVEMLVAYTVDNDKITIKKSYDTTELAAAGIVTDVDDEFVTISGTTYDTTAESTVDDWEDYTFVKASAYADKNNYIVFESDVEDLGKGITGVSFKKGNRVAVDDDNQIAIIVEGFDYDDVLTAEGMLDVDKTVVEKVTESALAYEYDDGYKYSSTITVSGDTVTISATDFDADKDGVSVFSADTARFLGGLYRSEKIETITYKGTAYTWDTEGTLKGSNYKSEDGTTLVSVLRTAQKDETVSFDLELDNGETLVYAVENAAD